MIRGSDQPSFGNFMRCYPVTVVSAAIGLVAMVAPPAGALAQDRGASSLSHDLKARLEGGYDSNPLKLNSNITGAAYGRTDLDYRLTYRFARRQRVFVGGDYSGRRYTVGEADRDKGGVELGFRDSSPRLGEGRLRSTIGARYRFRNMTFVDQATGDEETVAGVPIGNRFDADWYEAFARFRADVTRATTLTLEGGARFVNYRDDFANLGLDTLDYNEYTVEPGFRQKIGGLTARLKLPLSYRVFDDRRAEDLNGADIAGSDLKYFYFGIDASLGDRKSESMRWTVGAKAERRLDNESGFADRSEYGIYGYVTFGRRDGNRYDIYLDASRREYDELDASAIDELDDGGRIKQGVRAILTYTHPVEVVANVPVDLYARVRGEAFDNSDRLFEYARYVLSIGLRKKF